MVIPYQSFIKTEENFIETEDKKKVSKQEETIIAPRNNNFDSTTEKARTLI